MTPRTIGAGEAWRAAVGPGVADWLWPRGCADLRHHGAADVRPWWRPREHGLRGRARRVAAGWNGVDVPADECLPCDAVGETDVQADTGYLMEDKR